MEPFRWCFIGAGRLANTVARRVIRTGRHEIATVYARRPEASGAFARRFGAVPCASAEQAMTWPGVDGVYVVTPHASHLEYARLALELGRPVLCEKPLTVNATQAEGLVTLSEERGVYLTEAMWTWFSPVAHKVKSWLDAGEYGEVERVSASYHMNIRRSNPRLVDPARAGGALLDIGIYPITYLYRLIGKPADVKCTGVVEGGVDLKEDVALTFADGATHTASVSMADFRGFERLAIKGSRAATDLWLFHAANRVTLRRKGGGREVFRADGGYVNEFDCVADEIRSGLIESPLVPHEATLDVMRIMDECRRQMGLTYPFERSV